MARSSSRGRGVYFPGEMYDILIEESARYSIERGKIISISAYTQHALLEKLIRDRRARGDSVEALRPIWKDLVGDDLPFPENGPSRKRA